MASPDTASSPYLVLARKYRPASFDALIGQDAMVQTLRNAFKSGRIPHAFMLTGIRGVGKTTTARILARALNFEDETGPHPTLDLSKEGIHDRAIIEGRHVDVIEMDAASNTGINDIREIIDSVKYGPVSAPSKVYVIDEVHMLSTAAFNGLLKTLEEPPPYVKFIFATTEIRKVPVTILSRCMRFDLRRITPEVMTAYLDGILAKEGLSAEPEALAMIVRAGEGSVRDCLSLLDQAISHGSGAVTAEAVKAMLGLADRARTIDLFEALMAGDIATALGQVGELYAAGADPQTLLADLADFTHLVTRIKIVSAAADDLSLTPDERKRGAELAGRLGMRALSRAWQILFKGFDEVSRAGNALQAAEMVLIRLAYAADLPTPDELLARLADQPAPVAPQPAPPPRQWRRRPGLAPGAGERGPAAQRRAGAAGCAARGGQPAELRRAGRARRRKARPPGQARARGLAAAIVVQRRPARSGDRRRRRPGHHPDALGPPQALDRPQVDSHGLQPGGARPHPARGQAPARGRREGHRARRPAGAGDPRYFSRRPRLRRQAARRRAARPTARARGPDGRRSRSRAL